MSRDPSRREALRSILIGTAAALGPWGPGPLAAEPEPAPSPRPRPGKAVVARARRDGMAAAGGSVDAELVAAGLGAAIARALGEESAVAALRSRFGKSDVVGIKVNCIAGKGLSNRPEVTLQVARLLQEAGVPAGNIVIWDRTSRELEAAGYKLANKPGAVRVVGIDQDYDWTPREWGPSASCFPKLLLNEMTALINIGVVKDHGLAGVSGGMKNWYGAIHNPNKLHDDGCNPYIPHLAAYPLLRDKLRLTVIDGTVAQCHGGPGRNPRWAWSYSGFLASADPVAVDSVLWQEIEARRREVKLDSLAKAGREPRYIAAAAALGLGVANPASITVEDV